jgi:hypothetical protein
VLTNLASYNVEVNKNKVNFLGLSCTLLDSIGQSERAGLLVETLAYKRRRRWLWLVPVAAVAVAAGGVYASPPLPPKGEVFTQSTADFAEEQTLAWGDEALAVGAATKTSPGILAGAVANIGKETIYGWGNGVTNVFTGDFNGDGKWDIGVTGTADDKERTWYIRYGDGKGGFGNQTAYNWGNGVTNVFAGDFNGDGKWDIGVTGTDKQNERYWYIRYGDGKGNFGNQTTYWWGNGVTNIFTGDFNGDGKWDIGVTGTAAQNDRNWYIRYGDGKGSFGNQTTYWWGNGVTNVFTGDFNGDGKWDIGVTGTSAQKERTWYMRYGNGKGQFAGDDTYTWNNGVTNVFSGDFNGDRMWDIGVTGDRLQKDGNWYIRYNMMKKQQPNPNPPTAQVDPRAETAGKVADTAYSKLLGRWPRSDERQSWIDRVVKQGASYEDIWTGVARSQERLNAYGYYAPSVGAYNGKTEQCFGAVGPKCDGVKFMTPDPVWVDTFTRPDGVKMGYIKMETVVGSILHDNTCLDQPMGAWCSGLISIPGGELPIIKMVVPAAREWNKAVYNVRDHRGWLDFYGPYPVDDKNLFGRYSDDLTRVKARPSLMAKVGPLIAAPITTDPYEGQEARSSARLKAPSSAYVDRGDAAYCASRSYKEEGQWWTAQWWGKCN